MTWTKERVSLLIDLWTSGKSASLVAKEIGSVSRNAVIGKIHRLGISNQKIASLKQSALKSKNSLSKNQLSHRTNVKKIILACNPNAPTEFQKISLLELREHTCRWPSGDPRENDFHFCGCPTHNNTPYCDYHAKIAYTQTSKRDAKQFIMVTPKPTHHTEEFSDTIDMDMVSMKKNPSENINFL